MRTSKILFSAFFLLFAWRAHAAPDSWATFQEKDCGIEFLYPKSLFFGRSSGTGCEAIFLLSGEHKRYFEFAFESLTHRIQNPTKKIGAKDDATFEQIASEIATVFSQVDDEGCSATASLDELKKSPFAVNGQVALKITTVPHFKGDECVAPSRQPFELTHSAFMSLPRKPKFFRGKLLYFRLYQDTAEIDEVLQTFRFAGLSKLTPAQMEEQVAQEKRFQEWLKKKPTKHLRRSVVSFQ